MNVSNGTYLGNDKKYADSNGYKKRSVNEPNATKLRTEIAATGQNAPIAKFIRYKIYKGKMTAQGAVQTKIFDYVFEGQSEFFDRNQYIILNYTIRYILNPDEVLEELAQKWIEQNS